RRSGALQSAHHGAAVRGERAAGEPVLTRPRGPCGGHGRNPPREEAVAKPDRARAPPPARGSGLGGGYGEHGRIETTPTLPRWSGGGSPSDRAFRFAHREERQASTGEGAPRHEGFVAAARKATREVMRAWRARRDRRGGWVSRAPARPGRRGRGARCP